jgi:hypothetical protein
MYLLVSQELVKYSSQLGEDTSDLQKALELMLGVPHRANDIKFISSIEGYHGNIHKLGRLLRHVSTFRTIYTAKILYIYRSLIVINDLEFFLEKQLETTHHRKTVYALLNSSP